MKMGRNRKLWVRGIAFAACGLAAGLFLQEKTVRAVDSRYTTAEDAQYAMSYKDIFYSRTAGSPLEYEPEDGVDTATGHLILQRTDLELEGMAGMDFSLCRYYDSNEATVGQPSVEHVDALKVENINIEYTGEDKKTHTFVVSAEIAKNHKKALKDMFISYKEGENVRTDTDKSTQRSRVVDKTPYEVYGISSGWSYDFPWIETVSIAEGEESKWAKKPVWLHWGSRGSMAIATYADQTAKTYSITGLEGYGYSDVKLEDYTQTVDGISCRYLLRDKTGLRTYFNEDGVVVLQKDAHDNTITYTYRDGIYFDRITDSVGREIRFHYGEETENGQRFLEKVTVQGKKTEGGVSSKTVKYAVSGTSYKPMNGKKLYGSRLDSVTVDGTEETYSYRTAETFVNTSGWRIAAHRADTNEAYLIKGVRCNGSATNYEYRAGTIRGTRDAGEGQKRDVATQFYYVTRQYEQAVKTKKKAGGVKYDYYQKQDGRKELVSFADGFDEIDTRQYGEDGVQNVTLTSGYNPGKHKDNGVYSDYTYKKTKLDRDTLQLTNRPKKNVGLCIYNRNKLPEAEIQDGKSREESLYEYDGSGEGSLVVLETERDYGTSRNKKPRTSKTGYTYDNYRNMLTERKPKAYLAKYAGKEHLFTKTAAYFHTSEGYPAEDRGYTLCTESSFEYYLSAGTAVRRVAALTPDGIDVLSEDTQMKKGDGAYQTVSRVEFTYDARGNETRGTKYPDCVSDPGSHYSTSYQYNELGQFLRQDMEIVSAKDSTQNRAYIQESTTYDFFGNELTYTDQNGCVTKMTYNEETGEDETVVGGEGSQDESKEENYVSDDGLSSMLLDSCGRCTVEQADAFGNTVIYKDEKSGTWTESDYIYGSQSGSDETPDGDEEEEEEEAEEAPDGLLVEERVYPFDPDGEAVTEKDGEVEVHYDISGRGTEVLSATRYCYDEYGEETSVAEFSGGAVDAEHCSSWTLEKETTETGEDGTVTTSYRKSLDPAAYQQVDGRGDYYTQFDRDVLSETVTVTETDEEGNAVCVTMTVSCGGEKSELRTTYGYDEFGKTVSEHSVMRLFRGGTWAQAKEIKSAYEYDGLGNVVSTEVRARLTEKDAWEEQTVKMEYDSRGLLVKSYTPRGTEENYATEYSYNMMGQQTAVRRPVSRKDGSVQYQLMTVEYDDSGNITAAEEQLTEDSTARTEYTYNERNELVCVKSCLEGEKAQYVQYAYDAEGNKIRQFTGMTEPLQITVSEGKGDDGFTFAGQEYHVEVSGGNKKDGYSETKYFYNKRNQLISVTDPEGNREEYTYDVYGNQVETLDGNGNSTTYKYDYQNRLLSEKAADCETGDTVSHTYSYDRYGNLAEEDGISYTYDHLLSLLKEERTESAGKEVKKKYSYDQSGNCASFAVSVGGKTELALSYGYDGLSRLTRVDIKDGDKAENVASYTYDADGNLSSGTAGNGLSASYSYHCDGTVKELTNRNRSGAVLSEFSCGYRLNGQKTTEQGQVQTEEGDAGARDSSYTYDRLGRLLAETHTGQKAISYTYDAHNNRREMTAGNKTTACRYNKNNELLRTDTLNTDTKKDAVSLYKYDDNGNQLAAVKRTAANSSREEFDLDITLGQNRLNENAVNHYDAQGQLSLVLTGDKKVSFQYDAAGYRTEKKVNGKTTCYIWDGDEIVMELDGKGRVKKRYIRGNSLVCADEGRGTEKSYYAVNPHGDVVQLTDERGEVTKTYDYDSFGNEADPDKKDGNPYRYAGEYYDKETGAVYLRSRYYSPGQGRFLTEDSYAGEESDPASLHRYAYCDNDGVNQVDPTGHWGTTGGIFIHKKITNEALFMFYRKKNPHTTIFCEGFGDEAKEMLAIGSVYPDYIKSKKGEKKKEKYKYLEKTLAKVFRKGNSKKESVSLVQNKLLGIKIWAKKGRKREALKDKFHGKSRKLKEKLCKDVENVWKGVSDAKKTRKKYLLVGCALHSIQDYYAHSSYSDTKSYSSTVGKKMDVTSIDDIFHLDFFAKQLVENYGVDFDLNHLSEYRIIIEFIKNEAQKISKSEEFISLTKKKEKDKDKVIAEKLKSQIHSMTKDDPYMCFVVLFDKGHWFRADSMQKNSRYKRSVQESASFIEELFG